MKGDVQPYPHGYCEAGLPVGGNRAIEKLPTCAKRGRWLVSGAVLCGSCKKKVVG